ncbi:MAG: ferredoxin III, nif-specific [Thiomonas sp.]|jgi:Nif-specific ferredoxin III
MSTYTITLPSGADWVPTFVRGIDEDKCIGCGRCFKVCPRGVLEMVGVNEDGERVAIESDADEDEEYEKKVMTIARQELCIGCTACARICPKKCYSHAALEV